MGWKFYDANGGQVEAQLANVPVSAGGTGATTSAAARTALGVGTGDSPAFTAVVVPTITGTGTITLDAVTDIVLDSGDADIYLKDDGNTFGSLTNNSGNLIIKSGTTTAMTFSGANATIAGIIKTDNATEATTTTDGSLQTDGGLSVVKDAVLGNDVKLISDAAILNFGVNSDVNLTHVHDTGLLLNSSRKIQFGDAGTFIHQSADGVLTIESDTTVDINGAVVLNGAITGATDITLSGELDAATLDISGVADIAGAVDLHATLDMNTNDIDNIRSATFITERANGATSGTMTIDWGLAQKQSVVLSDNTAFTFTAPDGPCNLILKVIHAANTTTFTPTWAGGSTNVDWPAATAPTFTQTSGSVDIVAFYYDGTNANGTYYGQSSLAFS